MTFSKHRRSPILGISWKQFKTIAIEEKGAARAAPFLFLALPKPLPEPAQLDFGTVERAGEGGGLLR